MPRLKPVYVHIIRIFLGALFVFSGVLKMTDLVTFSEAVYRFEILPYSMIKLVTAAIPAVEIVCGLFLMIGIFKKVSSLVLAIIVIIFTISIGVIISTGITFNCNCFGPLQKFLSEEMSVYSILFNTLLILLALVILKYSKSPELFFEFKILSIFTFTLIVVANFILNSIDFRMYVLLKDVEEINFNQSKEILEHQNAKFIDARDVKSFQKNHLETAVSIPYNEFAENYFKIKDLEKRLPIILYCDPGI